MSADNKVTDYDQILEPIVVAHYDQIFNTLLCIAIVGRVHFVVVPLDDQVFDSRSDLNAIVVPVYRKVLDVITHSLMAVVLVNGV